MFELCTAGVDSVIVYFGHQPSETLIARIGLYAEKLRQGLGPALLDLVPSYTSILVQYDVMQLTDAQVRIRMTELLSQSESLALPEHVGNRVELPVCYDLAVAPDLLKLSVETGLAVDEITRIHAEKNYRVFAIGFSPGFGYLGELDERLMVPRLPTPRVEVPAGSVAIAERSTAVYPQATPGGWWLIGCCPLKMFDKFRNPQSLIQVGDEVRFKPISINEFDEQRFNHD